MPPVKHPHPFPDLVELARPTTYDPQRSFKDQLRAIDVLRDQATDSRKEGDLENAYIYLGRAAAVITEHLPSHSQYNILTDKQKNDLANNGRGMLRSLQELEPQLKLRYREYQAGIANGTIAPPKRRRTGDDKDKRRPSAPTAERYAPEPPSAPVAMPRTPTSIEDHQTTTVSSASRSNRPTPGVTVMLSEAQEREQRERQAQLDRDRRRDYLSDEGRRAQAYAPAPIPESAIPTPVPTPDRRDMSTLSVSQYGPSTSSYHDRPPPRDESRQAPERSDAEMRAAMLDLQADYDAKLRACMEDPSPIDEEERMRRALDIVGRTGTAERQWIEEKSQQALRRGRQSTFTQELSDQGLIHDRRIKDVKAIFARRSEEIVRRERAERDAKALAESREREARYRAEAEARERALERELAQEREREREQQIRSDREHSEHERTRAREDQLLQQRRLEATQDAMSRVSLAQQRQQAETDDYANRQRRAQDVVQARIHQGQAERADRLQREAATAAWQEREREREVVAPRATYVTSPIPPAVTYSRQPSPSPAVLVRPQSSRVEQPTSYTPTPVLSPPPVSAPSMSRPSQPPVSPAPPVPMTAPLRRPQHSRADVQPTPNPPKPPQTAAAPSYSYIPRSRSPASYDSPPQHNSDRDLLDRSVPMLHNRASNIHMAGPPRSSSHPFSSHEKVTHYPPEKLTAIAALPIESPSHSFRGSLSDEQRETVRSFSIPISTSPPSTEVLPIASQAPNYPNLMTRHQQSQGYVPSQISSSFADGANPVLGGTPNGLLFQPVGVTKAPPQTEPYAQYSNRPGSFDRASVVNGPYPRPPKLRQIRLPADTLQRFVALAALNTAKKKETLAMLYGKANTIGGFDITTLVLPPQTGQEDSCQMTNEELIVDYTKSRSDSIMLGWIHTHPTQSCFMSSMDLHTHSQYQKMMPECIAIVCAPRHRPNFGIFRLTDPPGLDLITKCNKQGFHPHPDHVPIYTDADSEHVLMVKDYFIEIVDLR